MASIVELAKPSNWSPEKIDAKGTTPETWNCIDCGINTAPGLKTRVEIEQGLMLANSSAQTIDAQSEVYTVKAKVWKAANIEDMGGCLCVGCLEKRLGRFLRPKDFMRNHPFNHVPCTRRLQARRNGLTKWVEKQPDGSYQLCQVDSDGEVTSVPVAP